MSGTIVSIEKMNKSSFVFKEQMRIGASIADQLPKLATARDVAKQLGISTTMLRRIECQALFKVSQRMHESRGRILAGMV
jgi:DNA-directed RNA polymerase sigma subunit (sigma70/sigma32)